MKIDMFKEHLKFIIKEFFLNTEVNTELHDRVNILSDYYERNGLLINDLSSALNDNPNAVLKESIVFSAVIENNDSFNEYAVSIIKDGEERYSFIFDLNKYDSFSVHENIAKNGLQYNIRKHPKIAEKFIKERLYLKKNYKEYYKLMLDFKNLIRDKKNDDIIKMLDDEVLINYYSKFSNKNNGFDILKSFSFSKYEIFYDLYSSIKDNLHLNKFIKKTLHKNSQKLVTKEIRSYYKIIYENENNIYDNFRQEIGKKLVKYKTKDSLNSGLREYISQKSNFSVNSIVTKLKTNKLKDIEVYGNCVIAEAETYKQMSSVGSQSWCITTSEEMFADYINEENNNRQIIIFNFTKKISDPLSMIGLTIDMNGDLLYAHDKNDKNIVNTKEVIGYKKYLKKMSDEEIFRRLNILYSNDTILDKRSIYNESKRYNLSQENINKCELNLIDGINNEYKDKNENKLSGMYLMALFCKVNKEYIESLEDLIVEDIKSGNVDVLFKIMKDNKKEKEKQNLFKKLKENMSENDYLNIFINENTSTHKIFNLIFKDKSDYLLSRFVEDSSMSYINKKLIMLVNRCDLENSLKLLKVVFRQKDMESWSSALSTIKDHDLLRIVFDSEDHLSFFKKTKIPDDLLDLAIARNLENNLSLEEYKSLPEERKHKIQKQIINDDIYLYVIFGYASLDHDELKFTLKNKKYNDATFELDYYKISEMHDDVERVMSELLVEDHKNIKYPEIIDHALCYDSVHLQLIKNNQISLNEYCRKMIQEDKHVEITKKISLKHIKTKEFEDYFSLYSDDFISDNSADITNYISKSKSKTKKNKQMI